MLLPLPATPPKLAFYAMNQPAADVPSDVSCHYLNMLSPTKLVNGYSIICFQNRVEIKIYGDNGDRSHDLAHAKRALYH